MNNPNSGKQKHFTEQDQFILELFRADPQEAFALMFERYYQPLCLYAVQLTDSFGMAEDIVQDLFASLWEKETCLTITQNLRGYLFLAVRNNTYLVLRKKKMVSMEELFDTEISSTDNLYDEETLREKEKEVMQELQKLPKQELASITAVILENKRYKEAAQEMGISVNTLKTHLARALKRLRNPDYLLFLLFF